MGSSVGFHCDCLILPFLGPIKVVCQSWTLWTSLLLQCFRQIDCDSVRLPCGVGPWERPWMMGLHGRSLLHPIMHLFLSCRLSQPWCPRKHKGKVNTWITAGLGHASQCHICLCSESRLLQPLSLPKTQIWSRCSLSLKCGLGMSLLEEHHVSKLI